MNTQAAEELAGEIARNLAADDDEAGTFKMTYYGECPWRTLDEVPSGVSDGIGTVALFSGRGVVSRVHQFDDSSIPKFVVTVEVSE